MNQKIRRVPNSGGLLQARAPELDERGPDVTGWARGRVLTDLYRTRERFDTRIDLDELGLVCVDAPPCYEWYQDVVDFAARVADLSPETA